MIGLMTDALSDGRPDVCWLAPILSFAGQPTSCFSVGAIVKKTQHAGANRGHLLKPDKVSIYYVLSKARRPRYSRLAPSSRTSRFYLWSPATSRLAFQPRRGHGFA